MFSLQWDGTLSVGNKVIDEQHKEWIGRLKSLAKAIEEERGSRIISETLNFMTEYVKYHFTAEEWLMQSKNYPEIVQHKMEHMKFCTVLNDLMDLELKQKESVYRLSDSVNNFQISWLKNHILKDDVKLANFLREKDVAQENSR